MPYQILIFKFFFSRHRNDCLWRCTLKKEKLQLNSKELLLMIGIIQALQALFNILSAQKNSLKLYNMHKENTP